MYIFALQIHYDEFIPLFETQYPDVKWGDVEVCEVLNVITEFQKNKVDYWTLTILIIYHVKSVQTNLT